MTWADSAKAAILRAHDALPADATLAARTKAIDDAYPFGSRECFPYKAWLKERRAYLVRYGYVPKSAPGPTDLERMMRRAAEPYGGART